MKCYSKPPSPSEFGIIDPVTVKVLRLDGNSLSRVPTEALLGPAALQDLHLQDNKIGKGSRGIFLFNFMPCPLIKGLLVKLID